MGVVCKARKSRQKQRHIRMGAHGPGAELGSQRSDMGERQDSGQK